MSRAGATGKQMEDIFLYCTYLCVGFLLLNLFKVGLKGKSILLPSTLFAAMWAITSFGIYLVNQDAVDNNFPMKMTPTLMHIGEYQFNILLVCFAAFICARIKMSGKTFFNVRNLAASSEIPYLVKNFRWVLYLLFILGMFRMFLVVSTVGFDLAAIRQLYFTQRTNFSSFDLNLMRFTQYVLQFAIFYVCILGVNAAIRGISIKKILLDFLLFMPYQMSFGGRLYIISFFVPFLISYMTIKFVNFKEFIKNRKELSRLLLLFSTVLALIVVMQGLKFERTSEQMNQKSNIGELFYTSSSYIHMKSLWNEIPPEESLKLGLGRNCSPWFTTKSPEYTKAMNKWKRHWNPALICIPTMIPDMYLDFGTIGSYIVYFIIFYLIELYAMKTMHRFSFKGFIIYILLCMFAFNTASSNMSDNFRLLFIGILFINLFSYFFKTPKFKSRILCNT